MFTKFLFYDRVIYKIMWKNIVEPERPQITIRRIHISRWVPKATHTHSEYVILTAFLLQQWLHERASLLRYITLPVVLNLTLEGS